MFHQYTQQLLLIFKTQKRCQDNSDNHWCMSGDSYWSTGDYIYIGSTVSLSERNFDLAHCILVYSMFCPILKRVFPVLHITWNNWIQNKYSAFEKFLSQYGSSIPFYRVISLYWDWVQHNIVTYNNKSKYL